PACTRPPDDVTQHRHRDMRLADAWRTNEHQPFLNHGERVGEAARGIDGAKQLFVLIREEIVERAALITRRNPRISQPLLHRLVAAAVAARDNRKAVSLDRLP